MAESHLGWSRVNKAERMAEDEVREGVFIELRNLFCVSFKQRFEVIFYFIKHLKNYLCVCVCVFTCIRERETGERDRDRDRQCVSRGGAEKDRQNLKQAPD